MGQSDSFFSVASSVRDYHLKCMYYFTVTDPSNLSLVSCLDGLACSLSDQELDRTVDVNFVSLCSVQRQAQGVFSFVQRLEVWGSG